MTLSAAKTCGLGWRGWRVQRARPGVPDLYQGCELGSFSLVDPDNRRAVDFGRRRAMLNALDAGARARLPPPEPLRRRGERGLDELKLLVTARALRARREHADWYAGSYRA